MEKKKKEKEMVTLRCNSCCRYFEREKSKIKKGQENFYCDRNCFYDMKKGSRMMHT